MLAVIGYGPFNAGLLGSVLVITTPILLAGVGELISERAGVLNVGLEGMMLVGAFVSYLTARETGDTVYAVLVGIGGGGLFAVIMALVSIEAKADQIVAGIAINLLALGATNFMYLKIFGGEKLTPVHTIGNLAIPGLSKIPGGIGEAIFDQNVILYIAFLLVPTAWLLLYRSKWGLSIRAAGEMPVSIDTAGVSVRRVRWFSVLCAGCLSGLAGAYLVMVEVGIFGQNMTGGRGFLALVAVIFGSWRASGLLGAALVLGGIEALQIRLASVSSLPKQVWLVAAIVLAAFAIYRVARHRRGGRLLVRPPLTMVVLVAASIAMFVVVPHIHLPEQIYMTFPYVLALVLLAAAVTHARQPKYLTIPYSRK